jgi:hypothetical protein
MVAPKMVGVKRAILTRAILKALCFTTVGVRQALNRLTGKAGDDRVIGEQFYRGRHFMTIEITRPETEALIHQCLQSGQFHDVDELLVEALDALREKNDNGGVPPPGLPQKSLTEVFQMVRGLADDVDFSRSRDTGRPVDLS